jgi:hypothetical protein
MKKTTTVPSRSQFPVLRQICNLISCHLVPKLARETGVDKKARSFSPWSHLLSLIYAHVTHAIGLNDVCDGLRLHSGLLVTLRGATSPSRNNLSHANKERDASLAEKIFTGGARPSANPPARLCPWPPRQGSRPAFVASGRPMVEGSWKFDSDGA